MHASKVNFDPHLPHTNEAFTRYALPVKRNQRADRQHQPTLGVFQKTRELLPLMEVLEAKDSRREERVTLVRMYKRLAHAGGNAAISVAVISASIPQVLMS
ncbi:uncharacterized protein Aud_006098 [Aspergillus udagawae]|uniref:Uncharacterized protein n=1 Tax=Aspergillus udagawae TaxID=91492 RepID=A0A8E0QUP2_9EURO|nr:uncharacterized protein Aud_006098 [Aspergillus udagawae]GIC89674.1 hypothetical protein Aud_006098 [Aspergillus udagawae]